MITLPSKVRTEVAMHPKYSLMRPQFSPDGRWIAFHATIAPGARQIFAAPFSSPPAPLSQWIPVTDATTAHFSPDWSPDGKMIYFFSRLDGFTCLWSQRLVAATKQPIGSPISVYHFHRVRLTLDHPAVYRVGVARAKLVFSLAELTGNVWMMQADEVQGIVYYNDPASISPVWILSALQTIKAPVECLRRFSFDWTSIS
jgi:hypothetical protein